MSEGKDQGSEFVVCLPTARSAVSQQSLDDGPAVSSVEPRRILVVDDNQDAAASLAMLLELMGNKTQTANDGLEALKVAPRFKPDLILLDIGMPNLDGYETAHRIRQQSWGQKLVLVALTGWGQEADRRKSREAGFDHHLTKPANLAQIEKLLADVESPRR